MRRIYRADSTGEFNEETKSSIGRQPKRKDNGSMGGKKKSHQLINNALEKWKVKFMDQSHLEIKKQWKIN